MLTNDISVILEKIKIDFHLDKNINYLVTNLKNNNFNDYLALFELLLNKSNIDKDLLISLAYYIFIHYPDFFKRFDEQVSKYEQHSFNYKTSYFNDEEKKHLVNLIGKPIFKIIKIFNDLTIYASLYLAQLCIHIEDNMKGILLKKFDYDFSDLNITSAFNYFASDIEKQENLNLLNELISFDNIIGENFLLLMDICIHFSKTKYNNKEDSIFDFFYINEKTNICFLNNNIEIKNNCFFDNSISFNKKLNKSSIPLYVLLYEKRLFKFLKDDFHKNNFYSVLFKYMLVGFKLNKYLNIIPEEYISGFNDISHMNILCRNMINSNSYYIYPINKIEDICFLFGDKTIVYLDFMGMLGWSKSKFFTCLIKNLEELIYNDKIIINYNNDSFEYELYSKYTSIKLDDFLSLLGQTINENDIINLIKNKIKIIKRNINYESLGLKNSFELELDILNTFINNIFYLNILSKNKYIPVLPFIKQFINGYEYDFNKESFYFVFKNKIEKMKRTRGDNSFDLDLEFKELAWEYNLFSYYEEYKSLLLLKDSNVKAIEEAMTLNEDLVI